MTAMITKLYQEPAKVLTITMIQQDFNQVHQRTISEIRVVRSVDLQHLGDLPGSEEAARGRIPRGRREGAVGGGR